MKIKTNAPRKGAFFGIREKGQIMDKRQIAAILTAGIMVFSTAGCTLYQRDATDSKSSLHYYVNDLDKEAFVENYYWNGTESGLAIDIPDDINGNRITALGGFFGTGVPARFSVSTDKGAQELGYYYDQYAFQATDKENSEYKELVFDIDIGSNVGKLMFENGCRIRYSDDNGTSIYYEVVYNVTCSDKNETYYAKDGKLYLRADDSLVELDYPDGNVNGAIVSGTIAESTEVPEIMTSEITEQTTTTAETAADTTVSGTGISLSEGTPAEDIGMGMWLVDVADVNEQYYLYFDGMGSGMKEKQEYEYSEPFTYSIADGIMTIEFASTEQPQTVQVTDFGNGYLMLEWESDRHIEYMSYLGGFDFDWFDYYTNRELTEMAAAYLSNNFDGMVLGDTFRYFDAEDNVVIVQGDGETDDVKFVIDRFTAKGSLFMYGEEYAVDLANMQYGETITPAPWSPAVIQRQVMFDEGKPLGVMFLGMPYMSGPYAPHEPIYNGIFQNAGAVDAFDWIMDLPADRVIKTVRGKEMYLIVPFDEAAEVTVSEMLYDDETYSSYPDETLYHSTDGEPFIVVCNADRRRSDVLVTIRDSSGNTYEWYPGVEIEDKLDGDYLSLYDFEEIVYDFTDYRMVNGYYTSEDAVG
ncbi:MAG: hypothetical protein J6O50_01675 [Ruminiclostridium sp.]|nr:hypothetical protein [Ruminiclostridium sp.]